MSLLFVGMLKKLRGHTLSVDSRGHKIMPSIPQRTHDLSCQRFVQKLDYCFAIGAVTFGHRSVFDVLSCAFAQSFDVSEKWFISHDLTPYDEFRGGSILLAGGREGKRRRRGNRFHFPFIICHLSFSIWISDQSRNANGGFNLKCNFEISG